MNLNPAFFIISAARETLNKAEIVERTNTMERQLQGHGYAVARCTGRYGNYSEPSLIVIDECPGTADCHNDVLRLARVYRQESILAVDCNRAAHLIYCDSAQSESLGIFTCVSEREAANAGDYTERDGRYYICKPVAS